MGVWLCHEASDACTGVGKVQIKFEVGDGLVAWFERFHMS